MEKSTRRQFGSSFFMSITMLYIFIKEMDIERLDTIDEGMIEHYTMSICIFFVGTREFTGKSYFHLASINVGVEMGSEFHYFFIGFRQMDDIVSTSRYNQWCVVN